MIGVSNARVQKSRESSFQAEFKNVCVKYNVKYSCEDSYPVVIRWKVAECEEKVFPKFDFLFLSSQSESALSSVKELKHPP